jgi:proline dehydrogenase
VSVLDRLIASSIRWVPRAVVRRIAARYVAGESREQALATARGLWARGCQVTFDVLGEFVRTEDEAEATRAEYEALLSDLPREPFPGNVSIKLTAFGLHFDPDGTYRRVRGLVAGASARGQFVRIDMEDSSCTDATLGIYRRLRSEGLTNVGVVFQAYLRRTLSDIEALSPLRPNCRLCKGIYREPAAIAFQDPGEIRQSYQACLERLLEGGSFVGIATHDPALLEGAKAALRRWGLPAGAAEFQMLLGVAEGLRGALLAEGHRLRVYIPYGRDWYAYCVRRLQENPRIARHVLAGLLRRG